MYLDTLKLICTFLDREPCLIRQTLIDLNYELYGSAFVVNLDKGAGSCNINDSAITR